jgi:hypothetical protein
MLGEFEYLLVSAAARLGEDASVAAMRQEIKSLTGRLGYGGARWPGYVLSRCWPVIYWLRLAWGRIGKGALERGAGGSLPYVVD